MRQALLDLVRQGAGPEGGASVLGRSVRTRAGQVVYHQGDASDSVYILAEGQLRTFVGTEQVTTLLLRAPALVGDRDLLGGLPAQESAECLTPAWLLVCERDVFAAHWHADPLLRAWLYEDLLRRYQRACAHQAFRAQPLELRLLSLLYETQGRRPALLPPHELLASACGATTRSIRRALRSLAEIDAILRGPGDAFSLSPDAIAEHELDTRPTLLHVLQPPSPAAAA